MVAVHLYVQWRIIHRNSRKLVSSLGVLAVVRIKYLEFMLTLPLDVNGSNNRHLLLASISTNINSLKKQWLLREWNFYFILNTRVTHHLRDDWTPIFRSFFFSCTYIFVYRMIWLFLLLLLQTLETFVWNVIFFYIFTLWLYDTRNMILHFCGVFFFK